MYIGNELLRGKLPLKIHFALMEACGTSTAGYSIVTQWYRLFNAGQSSVKDEMRTGGQQQYMMMTQMPWSSLLCSIKMLGQWWGSWRFTLH